MPKITKEQFEQLPEFLKPEYEADGEEYQPRAEGKLNALKVRMDALDAKYQAAQQKITDGEAAQAAAIEAARAEALEQARSKGDVSAVEKRYQEQMADLERRTSEVTAALQAKLDTMANNTKTQGRAALVADVATQLRVFDDSRKQFSKLISDRIDIDPETGKAIFLNEDGGASSLDKAGFIAELAKDPSYNRLRQAEANQGGSAGGNNGSSSGGALKKWEQHTAAELAAIRKENPSEYDRLKNDRDARRG